MRLQVVDEGVRVDLEGKAPFLQGMHNLFLGARRHEDVVGEVGRDEEDGAVPSAAFYITASSSE